MVRVVVVYSATAFAVLQAADIMLPQMKVPEWAMGLLVAFVVLGFPIALVLAWALEVTPDGIKRTEAAPAATSDEATPALLGKRTAFAAALLVAVGAGLGAGWFLRPAADSQSASPAVAETGVGDTFPAAAENVSLTPVSKSIAVLPFVAMSRGEDDEYFADGLTEEILNVLSALPDLQVTARTSAFHFKGRNVAIPEVARSLGVEHVLEGSVRRSGNRLRITAQLIRAADGFHIWSQSYDRSVDDVFAVQDDIAQRVADALDILLDEVKATHMREAGIRDIEAFIAYQKGMALYRDAHLDNVDRIDLLRQANAEYDLVLERVPDFYGAHLHRTDLFAHMLLDPAFGVLREPLDPEDLATAATHLRNGFDRAYASTRLQAERNVVEVARSYLSSDWAGLDASYRRLYDYTGCITSMLFADRWMDFGGAQQMLGYYETQLRCDPYAWTALANLAAIHNWQGDFDATLGAVAKARERLGLNLRVESAAFFALVGKGDFEAARRAAASPAFEEPRRRAYATMVLAAEGRADEARRAAAEWHAQFADLPLLEMPLAAWLGDRVQANEIAARLDAAPLGAAAVTDLIRACLCGAPFDLDATPVFRQQLETSGLDWPPPTPLTLPLKDW